MLQVSSVLSGVFGPVYAIYIPDWQGVPQRRGASKSTFCITGNIEIGGKGGGELNLEPQTDEPKEKQVVNICNIYSVHRWGPQISLGFLTNTEKELRGKTTKLNERRRTAADDDGRTWRRTTTYDDRQRRTTTDATTTTDGNDRRLNTLKN